MPLAFCSLFPVPVFPQKKEIRLLTNLFIRASRTKVGLTDLHLTMTEAE